MDRTATQIAFKLALEHHQAGRLAQAEQLYRQVLVLEPAHHKACNNLGIILASQGNFDRAVAAYLQALRLKPDYVEALGNLGVALHGIGKCEEAVAVYRQAIALQPHRHEAYANLGAAFYSLGRLDESIAAYRQAIVLQPDFAEAHHNLALALLLVGQFEEGWIEYEWRWKSSQFSSPRRQFPAPMWDGSPLAGRTILVHAEQGIGDTIQFARYVPLVAQHGGQVLFECAPELARLMQHVSGMDGVQIIPRNTLDSRSLPPFDVHAPLMSLPRLLKLPRPADLPNSPYLTLNEGLLATSRSKLPETKRMRIGIAWAGSRKHSEDRRRSIPLDSLASLLRCDADFYSLQFGQDAKSMGGVSGLIDLRNDIHDFLDTAVLISQLDLVISVDTAVAHLAGAMGKPVWLLLAFAPDWRWQRNRDDSDWYGSVKLFRQTRPGDWDEVIRRVKCNLEQSGGFAGTRGISEE
jgi:hypothetical protein